MANILNQAGIDLIKSFEGCKLQSYQDSGGIWTVGYGITGKNIGPGMTITQDQANQMLADRLNSTASMIDGMLAVVLTSNQFSAIVSLGYNIGIGNLERSTLWGLLQANQSGPAALQFSRWDRVNGSVLKGLQARRLAEQTLFNTPDPVISE